MISYFLARRLSGVGRILVRRGLFWWLRHYFGRSVTGFLRLSRCGLDRDTLTRSHGDGQNLPAGSRSSNILVFRSNVTGEDKAPLNVAFLICYSRLEPCVCFGYEVLNASLTQATMGTGCTGPKAFLSQKRGTFLRNFR